jgi:hypothetical protein
MKHFLARLVERARGTAPHVEPIIAPRFLPASAAEAAPETEAAPKSNGEKMTPPPDKPSLLPVTARKGEPAQPRGDAAEAPIEVVQETLLVPPGIPEAPAPFVVRQTDSQRNGQSTQTNAIALEKNEATKPKTLRASHAKPQRAQPRAFLSETVLASLPDEPRDQAPIVRVTIGRIDVRAAPAPPLPSRKPARHAGPTLTLDAYLKQRKEGAR